MARKHLIHVLLSSPTSFSAYLHTIIHHHTVSSDEIRELTGSINFFLGDQWLDNSFKSFLNRAFQSGRNVQSPMRSTITKKHLGLLRFV